MSESNSVFVTGGDGFLGLSLTRRLIEHGYRVVVVDNHSTSRRGHSTERRKVIDADVCDVPLEHIGPLAGIFHLASPAAPSLFADRPNDVLRPNMMGTERLLELAEHHGCRMLFFSSSEVYGHGDPSAESGCAYGERQTTSHELLTARSCYGVAKRAGEELVKAWRQTKGVDASAVRPFNIYGPGMDPTLPIHGRVVPNFLGAISRGEPLRIHGDGHQCRSFLWVDDFVDAVVGLFHHDGPLPVAVNIGYDEPISINDLADHLESLLGRCLERDHVERSPHDVDWRRPDCSLIRSLTGWEPTVTLEQGLGRLLASMVVQEASA